MLLCNFVMLEDKNKILQQIKNTVLAVAPNAVLILYGSYARGDYRPDSDIDILVLIDKDKITWDDEIKISYPLYDIELETGTMISPMIYSKKGWANHRVSPFYENVNKEGVVL